MGFRDRGRRGDGTRLRQWATLGPGPSGLTPAIKAMPDKEERIIARRLAEHEANMRRCLDGIKNLPNGRGMRPGPARGTPGLRLAVEASAVSPEAVDFVREAERLGVHAAWVPEMWGYDALTQIGYLAARTSAIRLGTSSCSSAPAPPRCWPCQRCPRSSSPVAVSSWVSASAGPRSWRAGMVSRSENRSRPRGKRSRSSG